MLVLVIALAGGLRAGAALGGSIGNLEHVTLRLPWTAVVALLLQVVAFSPLSRPLPDMARVIMHVTSYGLLLAFVAANLRRAPIVCFGLGVLANTIAIALNGGYMPASAAALRFAGLSESSRPHNNSELAGAATQLRFLGDILAVPHWLPLANVFSVGDCLIAIGLAWLVADGMRRSGG
ncbi:MAG: DUF5317 domain-containing protein [Thermoleophilia bacterium]